MCLQEVNNPIVKEILEGSNVAKTACVLVYCVVAPLLEETVYRGFLLRSLSSTMQWQQAVLISSLIFSAAHLSVENFIQLFIIGCVLGCSYCWTGNLCSSFAIHSLYNSMTLIITFFSWIINIICKTSLITFHVYIKQKCIYVGLKSKHSQF